MKVINSLFAPCLSALVISCCEYFLISVKLRLSRGFSFYWLQIGYICQLATIWDCCSVDSLETETPKEITNMFDSIGKLTSKIQFE